MSGYVLLISNSWIMTKKVKVRHSKGCHQHNFWRHKLRNIRIWFRYIFHQIWRQNWGPIQIFVKSQICEIRSETKRQSATARLSYDTRGRVVAVVLFTPPIYTTDICLDIWVIFQKCQFEVRKGWKDYSFSWSHRNLEVGHAGFGIQ